MDPQENEKLVTGKTTKGHSTPKSDAFGREGMTVDMEVQQLQKKSTNEVT